MKLTKPIEDYTLKELLLALKADGYFKSLPTNHITEATNRSFPGNTSPIDLSGRKLGDIHMKEVMTSISIQHLRQIKHVGITLIEKITAFVQEHDINWPVEIQDTK